MNPEDYEEQHVGPKQFKRKNTKKWCKGKVGREHVPVVEYNQKYSSWQDCGRHNFMHKPMCNHHVVCENCGKELAFGVDVCPTTGLARKDRAW